MKTHVIHDLMPGAPEAYLSNGVIGLRAGRNPLQELTGLLNGFSGVQEIHGVEALAPIPCAHIDICTGRSALSGHAGRYAFEEQAYDFACGELRTAFTYRPADGPAIACTHAVFCTRSSPTLYLSELALAAQDDVEATLCVRIDAASLPVETRLCKRTEDCDGVMRLTSRGEEAAGDAGIAYVTEWTGEGERLYPAELDYEREALETRLRVRLKKGEVQRLRVMVSCVPGALHGEPHWQAVRMIKLALWEGFGALREKNRAAWGEIWEGRVRAPGAPEIWQDRLDAAFFYLNSSMHTSSPFSIAPCGLGNRFLYKGHVFWDTESFMFLLPLLTAPHVAESMLDYRFTRLDAARRNAKIQGYRGVQFSWQSFATGDEVTRVSASQAGGAGEQHVNLDVALAFALYVRVSGDPVFLKERAWPVLRGVAQWIESRVTRTARGYEILHVTGIDEEIDNVDNNAYTNILSALVLRAADEAGRALGYPRNSRWNEIADGLLIPVHPQLGYVQQYEGAPLAEILSCEAMMAYFPYGCHLNPEVDAATLRIYVERGMERQLHYPMMSGFLGVFPAWLGDRQRSLRFFEKANGPFLRAPYLQSVEWASGDGAEPDNMPTPFLTGRGSFLAGVMLGLTRLNLWKDADDIAEGPITLPEGWDAVILDRIYLQGRPARVTAYNGAAKAEIEWMDENKQAIPKSN